MNETVSDNIAAATQRTPPETQSRIDGGGAIVAYVEVDRYCPKCAYNLRTQTVRRDGPTQLLVARCPECGSFDAVAGGVTASKPWLNRLATLALSLWVLILLASIIGLSVAQGAINYAILEEFTTWQRVPMQSPTAGNAQPTYQRVVRPEYPTREHDLIMGLALLGSFAAAFLLIAMLSVSCHHWRRAWYAGLAVVHAFVVSAFVWEIWKYDNPGLFEWGKKFIVVLAIVRLIGALLAAWAGRPLARLTVRVFLPRRIRSVLSFLWFADGLEPPRKKTPADEAGAPTAGA